MSMRNYLANKSREELYDIAEETYEETDIESDNLTIIARILACNGFKEIGVEFKKTNAIFAMESNIRLYWMQEHRFSYGEDLVGVPNPDPPLGVMLSTVVRNATDVVFNEFLEPSAQPSNLKSFIKKLRHQIDLSEAMELADITIRKHRLSRTQEQTSDTPRIAGSDLNIQKTKGTTEATKQQKQKPPKVLKKVGIQSSSSSSSETTTSLKSKTISAPSTRLNDEELQPANDTPQVLVPPVRVQPVHFDESWQQLSGKRNRIARVLHPPDKGNYIILS